MGTNSQLAQVWTNADPKTFAIAMAPNPPAHERHFLSQMRGSQVKDLGVRSSYPQIYCAGVVLIYYRHGDMLFAFYDDVQVNGNAETSPHSNGATLSGDVHMSSSTPEVPEPKSPVIPQKRPRGVVKQDPVDDVLEKQDGKIPRQRDPKMCKHGPKGMCDYCMPLEVSSPTRSPLRTTVFLSVVCRSDIY